MIQDATDQQIKAIQEQFPLTGKVVLEIGCGKGRVTRDLAKHAKKVIATDPDAAAINTAQSKLSAQNVEFICATSGIPDLPDKSVDLVIYSLSLHHVPTDEMQNSLLGAGTLLKKNGAILVLEPGAGGTFNLAKSQFGVGSGNEGPLIKAALAAMQTLPGWQLGPTHRFMTEFLFSDEDDFFSSKLPRFADLPVLRQQKIYGFLAHHKTERGIVLTSERHLNLLQPLS